MSYAWRGPRGCGKRTRLLDFLKKKCDKNGIDFRFMKGVWTINKNGYGSGSSTSSSTGNGVGSINTGINNADEIIGEDGDEETAGKIIPYESSNIHLGFDVARMSMSDKGIIQSILYCWTGQVDVTLLKSNLSSRYLVLYHAHLLTDESILQIQECLEKYSNFKILITTEMPICWRISDYVLEIPCSGDDILLRKFLKGQQQKWSDSYFQGDVWKEYFLRTADRWSQMDSFDVIADVRNWIYVCLQRNLRWTDVIQYWIEIVWEIPWVDEKNRSELFYFLSNFESGGGWNLIPSYRIPILWERNHLEFAKLLRNCRKICSLQSKFLSK